MLRDELMPAIAETTCFSESNYRPSKNCGILCPMPDHVKSFFCVTCHESFNQDIAYSSYIQAALSQQSSVNPVCVLAVIR